MNVYNSLKQTLDKQYDSMRDKLLLEALMRQHGDNSWTLISEQERQNRLVQLRREEKQLRAEGTFSQKLFLLFIQAVVDKSSFNCKVS